MMSKPFTDEELETWLNRSRDRQIDGFDSRLAATIDVLIADRDGYKRWAGELFDRRWSDAGAERDALAAQADLDDERIKKWIERAREAETWYERAEKAEAEHANDWSELPSWSLLSNTDQWPKWAQKIHSEYLVARADRDSYLPMVAAARYMTTAFPDYQSVADDPRGHGTATRNLFATLPVLPELGKHYFGVCDSHIGTKVPHEPSENCLNWRLVDWPEPEES